jgi:PAT family beta-lactamase induction signal transducer AmpG
MFWPVILCILGAGLAAPPRIFDAIIGPLIEFFRAHGWWALLMLLMISVYRLPEFLIGPVAGPFYIALGLEKAVVGGVRATVGLFASIGGIAAGGICAVRLGFNKTLILGAILQGLGVAAYAVVAHYGAHDLRLFAAAMASDNFCYAFAGVALVAYMSSLTSLGYTATQYALLSSIYTLFGKFLKGYSGWAVDQLHQSRPLMESYGLFYVGAGAIALPALILCIILAARRSAPKHSAAPA